ncbi:MAG: D-amino-acid transaminase [Paracoccus sp. (in: a-proteobacteria)]|nr:D-amino-acid transaminase [Paracoccus sp. (in: a-proteobacteria)]
MSRIVYLNGEYLPEAEAKVSIFDRGFVMADAVYEVVTVLDGKLIDFDGHLARLDRSLAALEITQPLAHGDYLAMFRELVARNDITDGMIYLQVTRGNPGDRDFTYPVTGVTPTVSAFTQAKPDMARTPSALTGISVITVPDERWGRRDIKTTQLLYPSLAKMKAKAKGAHDAWMVEDGKVTEGTSNNAYIIKDGRIITRELSHDILHGITREAVLRLAREAQMTIEERAFTPEEAMAADEAFVTSASAFVTAVVEIDGAKIGAGTPGPVATRLRDIYLDEMRKTAI